MPLEQKKKLTLRIDERLLEQAKRYAARHHISLSELVEMFFRSLGETDEETHAALVRRLTGLLPESVDVEQLYGDHLLEKYRR